jgi:4-amino-4-deoxy-L-arabinose transferase-like glycosyltransferase
LAAFFHLNVRVNQLPNPALVTQRAAQRLPRIPLLLLCAAYVLPGLIGRDPWKSADITAFGYMVAMAEGRTSWLAPTVGGLPVDTALLPHWLGAVFIQLLPWFGAPFAARVPFAILLALTLVLIWYTTFHLARSEAAQPLPFAFGGEANAVDYARALADGALLALIASLGLLQLGHETTPELAQLCAVALYLWSLAAAPYRATRTRIAVIAALSLLAASGAPAMAVAMGALGALVCARSDDGQTRRFAPWVVGATVLAAFVAQLLGQWALRFSLQPDSIELFRLGRLLLWFPWPAWLLALWTLWRWRRQLRQRHIALPLVTVLVSLVACIGMGGWDRALMLALPGLAVLAAFALPTMQRSVSAAVDWFSVFFFSVTAIAMWVVYAAMQTGFPAKTLSNVMKLWPGFVPRFSAIELAIALAATAAWLALVRWRTGRHQNALWKSLVLPASGVALCWLLLFSLGLPLLDYARSYRPWVDRVARHVPRGACVVAPGLGRAPSAALEYFGGLTVDGRPDAPLDRCEFLLQQSSTARPAQAPAGWVRIASERRPADRNVETAIFRRKT